MQPMPTRRTPLAGALAASLGEERLAELRDQLTDEIHALQLELTFVEAALSARPRRNRSASRQSKPSNGASGRFAGIKRENVLALVKSHGQSVKPAEMVSLFAARGQETNVEAMRTALNRLVKDGSLVKLDPSTFAVPNGTGSAGHEPSGQIPQVGSAFHAESR